MHVEPVEDGAGGLAAGEERRVVAVEHGRDRGGEGRSAERDVPGGVDAARRGRARPRRAAAQGSAGRAVADGARVASAGASGCSSSRVAGARSRQLRELRGRVPERACRATTSTAADGRAAVRDPAARGSRPGRRVVAGPSSRRGRRCRARTAASARAPEPTSSVPVPAAALAAGGGVDDVEVGVRLGVADRRRGRRGCGLREGRGDAPRRRSSTVVCGTSTVASGCSAAGDRGRGGGAGSTAQRSVSCSGVPPTWSTPSTHDALERGSWRRPRPACAAAPRPGRRPRRRRCPRSRESTFLTTTGALARPGLRRAHRAHGVSAPRRRRVGVDRQTRA